MADKPSAPALIHNPHSPDVYADDATGFFTLGGNMRITLESIRSNYSVAPIAVDRVVVGRLVMPLSQAEAMARSILAQVEALRVQPTEEANTTLQ